MSFSNQFNSSLNFKGYFNVHWKISSSTDHADTFNDIVVDVDTWYSLL